MININNKINSKLYWKLNDQLTSQLYIKPTQKLMLDLVVKIYGQLLRRTSNLKRC